MTWNMARNSENVKIEKYILQDLDYGKKKLTNKENHKLKLQDIEYVAKTENVENER